MEERVTVKELLQRTVDLINGIMVPMAYANEIARPLAQAVQQIESCINAYNEAEKTEGVEDGCPSQSTQTPAQ